MGTKANPGKFDCYSKAAPDEPIFVLRSMDPSAPVLVRLWAAIRAGHMEQAHKLLDTAAGMSKAKGGDAKFYEALKCAGDMEAWAAKQRDNVNAVSPRDVLTGRQAVDTAEQLRSSALKAAYALLERQASLYNSSRQVMSLNEALDRVCVPVHLPMGKAPINLKPANGV